jgi:hypothetical protein
MMTLCKTMKLYLPIKETSRTMPHLTIEEESEIRNRLWWEAFMHDCQESHISDFPCTIPLEIIKISLPYSDSIFLNPRERLTKEDELLCRQILISCEFVDKIEIKSNHAHLVLLFRIYRQLKGMFDGQGLSMENTRQIDISLKRWYDSLPTELKYFSPLEFESDRDFLLKPWKKCM